MYSQPDFDSQVVEYLPFKTPVLIRRRAIPGRSGLGLFHFVRTKNKSGYVVDTDIRVTSDELAKVREKEEHDKSSNKKQIQDRAFTSREEEKEKEKERARRDEPLFFKRYIGGAFALVDFSEKFSGVTMSSQVPMVGLRVSGPGTLFDGPPLDFNLWFTTQTPDYYTGFTTSAKGFLVFGDVLLLLPFIQWKNTVIDWGVGMMYTYTHYEVQIHNSYFDSQEFRIGADADLGLLQRIGSCGLRLDAKYYYEKTHYLGWVLSLQVEY